MASKIQSHNFYVAITPYKVEDSSADEFNLLNVRTAFDDRRKYFYVDLHAGWSTAWGGFGCILMGVDNPLTDPLTGPKYVKVKDSPKNSQKTINEIGANLELAKDGIAWLFDRRDWTRLYAAVKNIALYGYTEQFRGQMEALMKSPTPDPIPEQSSPTRSLSPTGAGSGCADEEPETQTDGVRYRTATMADIEEREADLYMNGEQVWVMIIHRSETIGEDSEPKLDYIMLTNMKKVQVEDLQVIDNNNNNPQNPTTMKLNLSNKNNESANVQNNAQVNNAAIKREQSGAGSGYAEREQGRPQGNANEPIVRQVDVMGLMGALNRDGHARLSDHVIEDADAEEVKDEQEEEIQSVAVGEVTLASIMPVMQPIEGSEYGVKDDSGKEVKFESVAPTVPAPTKPAVNTGRTRIVVAGVPKPGESGDKPKKPVTLKKKQTEPQSPEAPRADTGSAPTLEKARYFVQLLPAKSGGLWPKLYGFKDEKSAKAMADKMPSSVNAKWDYGVNGEGRETKTRHWHLTAGKRYCDVMQELADALNKGDRVAVANAAAKACGVYAGVVAENTRIRQAMAA